MEVPKIVVPPIIQNQTALLLKLMVLGYPYFGKHPNFCSLFLTREKTTSN